MAPLIFVCVLVGIVLLALIVNKITGTKAHYIEDFVPNPAEKILWRDEKADSAALTTYGNAAFISFPRLRRDVVIATSERIIISRKALFSSKHMIMKMIFFNTEDPNAIAAQKFGGGFYPKGYQSFVAASDDCRIETVHKRECLKITPQQSHGIAHILIFADDLAALGKVLRERA